MHKQTDPTRRATVVLDHACGDQSHYDWMIEDPAAPAGQGRLCTWRVAVAPSDWHAGGTLELTRLGDHRRAYLQYEGELTGGRGSVRRVDEGEVEVVAWSQRHAVVDVNLKHFTGRVKLQQVAHSRWTAHIQGVET